MAGNSSAFWSVSYEAESAFGEDTDSASIRLRPVGTVDVSGLEYPTQDIGIVKQYPSESAEMVRMPKGGSFSIDLPLTGLGSTAASAPAASALVTLLGKVFGTAASVLAAGDTFTGGTAAVPTTTGASGVSAGGIIRCGSLGDARGNGQFAAVATHSSNNLNLLTALPAAPNNGDVLYCARNVYQSETAGTMEAIASIRFELKSSQQQYILHGCYPTAVELPALNPGDIPMIKVTFGVAWWETANATFPDSTDPDSFSPVPIAAGSFFINDVGTATRATATIRKFSLNYALDNKPIMGVGGVHEHQTIVGCFRGPSKITLSMVIDSEAAGTDTWGAKFDVAENVRVRQHALYTLSSKDGYGVAFYWPNLKFIGKALPTQMNDDGINRKTIEFEATTGATKTNDLTMAPMVMAFA